MSNLNFSREKECVLEDNFCRKYAIKLIYFQIIYNIAIKFMIAQFGIPTIFNYVSDIITIVITILSLKILCKDFIKNRYMGVYLFVYGLLFFSIIGWIINRQSITYFAWGLRNTYRFFIFFFCCAVNLRKQDYINIIDGLIKILPLNVILCTYQYITLQGTSAYVDLYLGDFVGGVFGAMQSSNGAMNIYLTIILSFSLVAYMYKKFKISKLISICLCSFYIAMLAEMKIIYVEIFIIFILVFLLSKKSYKTIMILLVGFLLVSITLTSWTKFNPDSANYLTVSGMIDYSTKWGYAGDTSINRLTAIPTIADIFFKNDISGMLLGKGLGAADTSSFSFLVSPIYKQYGELKYTFFLQSMLFLETGIIGLILYVCFFLHLARYKKLINNMNDSEKVFIISSAIFSLLSILNIWYNNSLRMETCGYLAFFWCALPLVWINNESEVLENIIKKRKKIRIII